MSLTFTNDAEPAHPETTSEPSDTQLPTVRSGGNHGFPPRSLKAVSDWPLPCPKVLAPSAGASARTAALLTDPETTSRVLRHPNQPSAVGGTMASRPRSPKSREWLAKYAMYDRNSPTTKLGAPPRHGYRRADI
jgi:hypothetical protein